MSEEPMSEEKKVRPGVKTDENGMVTEVDEAILQEWQERGKEWGLTTKPVDESRMVEIVHGVYKHILEQEVPEEILLFDSPYAAWQELVRREQEEDSEPLTFVWPVLDGHWSAHYYAWAECYRDIGVSLPSKALDADIATRELGPLYTMPNYCLVCNTPKHIKCEQEQNRLHAEDGPAVEYRDGWGVYALHGVRVPKEIVMTPLEEIDKKWLVKHVIQQENADVKREAIGRIGINKFVELMDANVLDSESIWLDEEHFVWISVSDGVDALLPDVDKGLIPDDAKFIRADFKESGETRDNKSGLKEKKYQLLQFDLGDSDSSRALSMENPSCDGMYHSECVRPECQTVLDALEFRNGTRELPSQLA